MEKDFDETEGQETPAEGGESEEQEAPPERSDDEKEEALAESTKPPTRKDPTEGMSDGQKVEFWRKRADHFEGDYRKERTKRQDYDKKYGGLTNASQQIKPPVDNVERLGPPRSLDEVQDLSSYTRYILQEAAEQFEKKLTERQMDARVESTEAHAREIHNGEDGLPVYDELVDEFVVPMIKKNPKVFDLIRLMPDPAEASYTLGFLLKYPKFEDMMKSYKDDSLVKNINSQAKFAATVKGRNSGRQPTGRLSKAEIDSMNADEFEKVLEQFKAVE